MLATYKEKEAMNITPTKICVSEDAAENLTDIENDLSSQIISEITKYFQGRIAKDINDMAGHIVNTLNTSIAETEPSEDVYEELEKYKSLVKIQQSIVHITNVINNSCFNC